MNDAAYVVCADRGSVRWLTLSQPDRKNAIPPAGWQQITEALQEFAESDQRVLVIRGAGDDFCSGADLHLDHLEDLRSPARGRDYMRLPGTAATTLHRLPKPTVAAVDGVAVGAGMNLALGCDIVVASDRALFAEVFVKRGLTLDFGGTWLLPRVVGMARARELALTGRSVAAGEALAIGLVARVVEPDLLESHVGELADELAAGAPLAQRFIKIGLSRSLDMTFEQSISYEDQAQATLLASDDLREGVAAFLERRGAQFEGR